MVPQSKRRAFLRWWEASAPWSRTAFTFKYAQLELLIWFGTFARGPAFAAASHDLKHPLEVGEESSPVGPTHRRSLQCWLVPHTHCCVLHHSMASRKVAVPAAGADGVGAAYSHPPALPALLVCLMVELPGPTAAVSRAGWLESCSKQGWCWWPARAGCWLMLPLPALLESWWLPWLPAVGCA